MKWTNEVIKSTYNSNWSYIDGCDFAATVRDDSRREAIELACKAVCDECRHGKLRQVGTMNGVWYHGLGIEIGPICQAGAIRDAARLSC